MSPVICPGARVLVRWAGVPHASPCHLHAERDLPLFQSVGVVDRIDERCGEHSVVVGFPSIICPPFGEAWVDAFAPDELVLVASAPPVLPSRMFEADRLPPENVP